MSPKALAVTVAVLEPEVAVYVEAVGAAPLLFTTVQVVEADVFCLSTVTVMSPSVDTVAEALSAKLNVCLSADTLTVLAAVPSVAASERVIESVKSKGVLAWVALKITLVDEPSTLPATSTE